MRYERLIFLGSRPLPINTILLLLVMSTGLSTAVAQETPKAQSKTGRLHTEPMAPATGYDATKVVPIAPESSGYGSGNATVASSRPVSSGRPGAQSLADFTELIALIRSTVDGQWDSGEDKIETFIGGVWIDPAGKLHREKTTANSGEIASASKSKVSMKTRETIDKLTTVESDLTAVPMLDAMGLDREEALRWVSIREVDELLNSVDRKSSARLELLGGLSRIDYVARDPKTHDWYLGGPAGGLVLDTNGNLISRSTGLPPVLLEDLLGVAPLILQEKGPLGCSIDPVPESLQKLSEQIKRGAFVKLLRSKPEKATQFLSDNLGDQRATFFGLPNDSPTAMALLVADEHMKRVGLGMVGVPPILTKAGPLNSRVVNYWQACQKSGVVPGESMVRWWFALPTKVSIGVDESGDVFSIDSSTVRVLSQKQFLDERGDRHDAAEKDLAADAFADSFTEAFPDLQKQFSGYGRLRHIFDLAVALQVIAEETPDRNARPLSIASNEEYRPRVAFPIQWVPSIAAWRKTDNGRVAAVVSGGVMVDISKTKLDRSTTTGFVERKQSTQLQ